MSLTFHIRTSAADEELIETLRGEFREAPGAVHKWQMIRLALAFAMRLPDLAPDALEGRSVQYDLQQVTGLGKGALLDLTGPLQQFLQVSATAKDETFARRLESEVGRGFALIRQFWRPGKNLWVLLAELFAPGFVVPVLPIAREKLAEILAPLSFQVDAQTQVGPHMTCYNATGRRRLGAADLLAIRSAVRELLPFAGQVDIVQKASGVARIAIERSPESWRRVGADDLLETRGKDLLALGCDCAGQVVTTESGVTNVVAGPGQEQLRLSVFFAAELAARRGEVWVIAAATSPAWKLAWRAPVRRILPEDPSAPGVLSGGASVVVLDGLPSLPGGASATGAAVLWITQAPADDGHVGVRARLFGGNDTARQAAVERAGIDPAPPRRRDAILESATRDSQVYDRVHLLEGRAL